MKNIEFNETGLKCDNSNCDWKDETISFMSYKDWLNKPCPKCGENVLTDQDFYNAQSLQNAIDFVNSLSEDQLMEMAESLGGFEALKGTGIIKNEGILDSLTSGDTVSMVVDTHEKISVEIKKEDEEG